ncbi:MAG TPA: Fic family protein [Mucilaginibacter sp.]|jgi:Fic family protein
MDFKLEIEFSKVELLYEVDALKKQIDEMRPLPADVEGRVMQKLRLDWNYHSNAIEGNRLTYGETIAFLMEGITAKGKPLKDHLDIRGHNEAINFLLEIVKDTRPISEADIRSLHKMILVEPYATKAQTAEGLATTKQITLGEYKTQPNHVKTSTGETHYYATPEETPGKMQELMEWYTEAIDNKAIHPVVTAALFHHKFVSIHPFDDGNGRLSRILMNLILMQKGYPPVVIKMDDRQNYYALLSRADNNDNWPFIEYIAKRLQSSLQLYLKAAQGGDIDEDEDIDKEIALFKMELKNEVEIRPKKSNDTILDLIKTSLYTLFRKITLKANEFDEFFESNEKFLAIELPLETGTEYLKIPFTDVKFIIQFPDVNFDHIYYNCNFFEFRNAKSSVGISIRWKINFYKYHYTIADSNDKQVISNNYDVKLDVVEQRRIIKYFINELKSAIRRIV